jgi:hypothetical protein
VFIALGMGLCVLGLGLSVAGSDGARGDSTEGGGVGRDPAHNVR